LSGALLDEHCFCTNSDSTGCCPNGSTEQSGPGSAEDDQGHGTQMAGVITGDGIVAPRGIAPGAKLVVVKVLDRFNRFSNTAQVVSALDWILMNHSDVQVVNMSLGTDALFSSACDSAAAYTMAFAEVIDSLTTRGTTVFASSGNQASASAIAVPACVEKTVAVGAVYDSNIGPFSFNCSDPTTAADRVTCFTNSSSSVDVVAPGALITASARNGGVATGFGTSPACAHASATASLILETEPGISPSAIEQRLKSTGVLVQDPKNGLSFPRIDALAATNAPPRPASFYTLVPCRLVDTRRSAGPQGSASLQGGQTRSFSVVGNCGVPPSARAVALNVTITNPTDDGHLKLFPSGTPIPSTSTINFRSGATRANNAIIPLGSGAITVDCGMPGSGKVDLVLDVTAYAE
jgi:hypothetical protein